MGSSECDDELMSVNKQRYYDITMSKRTRNRKPFYYHNNINVEDAANHQSLDDCPRLSLPGETFPIALKSFMDRDKSSSAPSSSTVLEDRDGDEEEENVFDDDRKSSLKQLLMVNNGGDETEKAKVIIIKSSSGSALGQETMSSKTLCRGTSSLGQHFTAEENHLQLLNNQIRGDQGLQRLKLKKLVTRCAKVLTHLVKVKKRSDPTLKQPINPLHSLTT